MGSTVAAVFGAISYLWVPTTTALPTTFGYGVHGNLATSLVMSQSFELSKCHAYVCCRS